MIIFHKSVWDMINRPCKLFPKIIEHVNRDERYDPGIGYPYIFVGRSDALWQRKSEK